MKKEKSVTAHRRRLLQQLSGGSAAGVACVSMGWTRPIVDAIILPSHAQTTPTAPPVCDVIMTVASRDVPSVCSGADMPPASLAISVSGGVDDVVIDNITAVLPGNAVAIPAISVGDTVNRGSSFNIVIDRYPTNNAAVCLPSQAGSILIDYSCVSSRAASASFSIDVLAELL